MTVHDLLLGVRLAVGGGRTSWTRLALGTIGIGLAVGILLLAASVPAMFAHRDARENAVEPVTTVRPGVSALYLVDDGTDFQGQGIDGRYLYPAGPNAPMPPGLTRLPGPDEVVLSPALADLLASPAGALLRPRFPERVVGTIGPAGLSQPTDLVFYGGAGPGLRRAENVEKLYGFGVTPPSQPMDPLLLALVVVGAVVLLVPIVIFIGVSSRIAGAQRDRRLAALRLVGAGARQTRRIAAAESLVAAATGLVLGVVAFLVARQVAGGVALLDHSVFPQDITPPWGLVALVVLLVPVIAVGSSLLGLRRTVIEPLGVVRESRPVRRRLWWRLGLLVLGAAMVLLLPRHGSGDTWTLVLATGASAVLIGVPAMLPWLLERAVGPVRGGPPSWQLAVRRLQLDSGTPARVVGGVAVVVAGAIALQTVMVAAYTRYYPNDPGQSRAASGPSLGQVSVVSTADLVQRVTATLRGAPGVRSVAPFQTVDTQPPVPPGAADHTDGAVSEPNIQELTVASCAVIQQWYGIGDCADGQVFSTAPTPPGGVVAGETVPVVSWTGADGTPGQDARRIGSWTAPATITRLPPAHPNVENDPGDLLVTPGAFHDAVPAEELTARYDVLVSEADANEMEYLRNALAPYTWQVQAYPEYEIPVPTTDQQTLATIRGSLLTGSLFTLLLAGTSLLVLALEQIRERRRPLAALAAAGAPRSLLARSLLWQNAVPMLIGVVVASAVGLVLAALVLRLTSGPMTIDWPDIGIFAGSGVVLAGLVTALTLPALRGATKLAALRTE